LDLGQAGLTGPPSHCHWRRRRGHVGRGRTRPPTSPVTVRRSAGRNQPALVGPARQCAQAPLRPPPPAHPPHPFLPTHHPSTPPPSPNRGAPAPRGKGAGRGGRLSPPVGAREGAFLPRPGPGRARGPAGWGGGPPWGGPGLGGFFPTAEGGPPANPISESETAF